MLDFTRNTVLYDQLLWPMIMPHQYEDHGVMTRVFLKVHRLYLATKQIVLDVE